MHFWMQSLNGWWTKLTCTVALAKATACRRTGWMQLLWATCINTIWTTLTLTYKKSLQNLLADLKLGVAYLENLNKNSNWALSWCAVKNSSFTTDSLGKYGTCKCRPASYCISIIQCTPNYAAWVLDNMYTCDSKPSMCRCVGLFLYCVCIFSTQNLASLELTVWLDSLGIYCCL